MNTPYYLTAIGFVIITLIFFYLLMRLVFAAIDKTSWLSEKKRKIKTRLILLLIGWAVVVSIGSLSGFTYNFDNFPLNAAPILFTPLIISLLICFSKNTREVLEHISPRVLVNLQSFRILVEILLWALFIQNLIPVQMTFDGRNLDILSGLLALVIGLFFYRNRVAMIGYNIVGFILLMNIVFTALLSMPTPFRVFMNEPANRIVVHFPFIFLPTFLVPLAYTLHFLSLRQLFMKK